MKTPRKPQDGKTGAAVWGDNFITAKIWQSYKPENRFFAPAGKIIWLRQISSNLSLPEFVRPSCVTRASPSQPSHMQSAWYGLCITLSALLRHTPCLCDLAQANNLISGRRKTSVLLFSTSPANPHLLSSKMLKQDDLSNSQCVFSTNSIFLLTWWSSEKPKSPMRSMAEISPVRSMAKIRLAIT